MVGVRKTRKAERASAHFDASKVQRGLSWGERHVMSYRPCRAGRRAPAYCLPNHLRGVRAPDAGSLNQEAQAHDRLWSLYTRAALGTVQRLASVPHERGARGAAHRNGNTRRVGSAAASVRIPNAPSRHASRISTSVLCSPSFFVHDKPTAPAWHGPPASGAGTVRRGFRHFLCLVPCDGTIS